MKFHFRSITVLFVFMFLSQLASAQNDADKPRYEAHWAGIDMGVSILTNEDMGMEFSNNEYWENDIAQSFFIHFNIHQKTNNFCTWPWSIG